MNQVTQNGARIGVGIDTARYGHRVTFLDESRNPAAESLTVMETREGYQLLQRRLEQLQQRHPGVRFEVRLDAAGLYAVNLERFLRGLPLPISLSVGQPKRNKDYQQVHFPKRKSDDTESRAMARFAVVEQPDPTPEVPQEFLVLREVASRLQSQTRQTARAVNQLHNLLARVFPELAVIAPDLSSGWVLNLLAKYPTPERIAAARTESLDKIPYAAGKRAQRVRQQAESSVGSLRGEVAESLVKELVGHVQRQKQAEKRLEKLLVQAYQALPDSPHKHVESIVGIGQRTAAVLVAKIVSIERFDSPSKLVGYFGFFPEEIQSGVDKHGRPVLPGTQRMSQKGNDLVRGYLWMASKAALVYNPAVRALYRRLRGKGVRADVAKGHCARKLLHLVFAVWKTDQPFNPQHYPWEPSHEASEHSTPVAQEQAAGLKQDEVQAQTEVTAADVTVERPSPRVNAAACPRSALPPSASRQGRRPRVDYAHVREQIELERVLRHLGHWNCLKPSRGEFRGPCPIHHSDNPSSRSFAVNPGKNAFRCFSRDCQLAGNALDFWSAYQRLPLYEATLHLAETFQLSLNREEEPVAPPKTPASSRQTPIDN